MSIRGDILLCNFLMRTSLSAFKEGTSFVSFYGLCGMGSGRYEQMLTGLSIGILLNIDEGAFNMSVSADLVKKGQS